MPVWYPPTSFKSSCTSHLSVRLSLTILYETAPCLLPSSSLYSNKCIYFVSAALISAYHYCIIEGFLYLLITSLSPLIKCELFEAKDHWFAHWYNPNAFLSVWYIGGTQYLFVKWWLRDFNKSNYKEMMGRGGEVFWVEGAAVVSCVCTEALDESYLSTSLAVTEKREAVAARRNCGAQRAQEDFVFACLFLIEEEHISTLNKNSQGRGRA